MALPSSAVPGSLITAVSELTLDPHGPEDPSMKRLYEIFNLNMEEWILEDFRPHWLSVNRGEDVIEKITSLSKSLGERSLTVLSVVGGLSSATLSNPYSTHKIESLSIKKLSGVFEFGKIPSDLSLSLYLKGDVVPGSVAGPLITPDFVQLLMLSCLKYPKEEFEDESEYDSEYDSESDMEESFESDMEMEGPSMHAIPKL